MEQDVVKSAIRYICDRDVSLAEKMQKDGLTRAVYGMLKDGGFDVGNLHKSGKMRQILEIFM